MVAMKTVETLCKYKDTTDLVYWKVHNLLTKDLIDEYNKISTMYFHLDGCSSSFPAFYDLTHAEDPCFNWRSKGDQNHLCPIYHVSFKKLRLEETGEYF